MNKKQKVVMWVGIIIIVLMTLFPVERTRHTVSGFRDGSSDYGYEYEVNFLFLMEPYQIEFSKLLLQYTVVILITGGLIVTLKDKKPNDKQKQ